RRGGRLVVAFFPETSRSDNRPSFTPPKTKAKKIKPGSPKPKEKKDEAKADKDKSAKPQKSQPSQDEDDSSYKVVSVKEKWGVDFSFKAMTKGDDNAYEPLTVENDSEPAVPATISWHSGMILTNLDKSW